MMTMVGQVYCLSLFKLIIQYLMIVNKYPNDLLKLKIVDTNSVRYMIIEQNRP